MADIEEGTTDPADLATQVGNAVAGAIARSEGGGGAPLSITTTSPINGSFDLQIVYGGTTYELKVTIPTAPGTAYVFDLSATPSGGSTEPLASFSYLDSSNWLVALGIPEPITIGPVVIKALSASIGEGDPTTTGTG